MNSQFPALGRQAATQKTYELLGAGLAKRLAAQASTLDPSELVAEFLSGSDQYSQRTFRLYKARLLQHLTVRQVAPSVLRTLELASSKTCAKTSGRTSGKKAKTVQPDDSALLLALLLSLLLSLLSIHCRQHTLHIGLLIFWHVH